MLANSEVYPVSWEGPDIWARIKLTPGTFRVACYLVNKDGQSGHNRYRDYLLEIRPYVRNIPAALRQ